MEAKITDTTTMAVMVIAPPTLSGLPKRRTRVRSIAPAVVEIQASGRQRGDGSCPSGNSNKRKGAMQRANGPPDSRRREIVLGAASDPGSTTSA